MNSVSQWWIGGLRTRKAKVMSSILMGGSQNIEIFKVYLKGELAKDR